MIRALVLLLAIGLSLSASGPIPDELEGFVSILQTDIARHRSRYEDPGIALAFVDDTGTISTQNTGLADRSMGRPVDDTTIFEMGSISKLLTCAAVLQLREQGLVDLDRPLRDYLPGFTAVSRFPAGAEAITVRMLMTHHSGLMMDDDPWETTVPARDFHHAVFEHIKDKPLLLPPGQKMRYSSFGVNLLGLLVEKVSGKDFQHYMKEQLFLPLDMPSASFDFRDHDPALLAVPYGYHPVWDLIPKDEIRPAGSLRAPVAEVGHFAAMILAGGTYRGHRVLSPESVAEMTRLQNGDNELDGEARVALGFMAQPAFLKAGPEREVLILFHYGQARTKSLLLLVPAWKRGLVASCNDYAATDASYNLFYRVWSGYLRALFMARGQLYGFHPAIPDTVEVPPGSLDALEGEYATTLGLKALRRFDGNLQTTDGALRFLPLMDGSFATEPWTYPRTLYRFHKDGGQATVDGYPVDRWIRLGPADLPPSLVGCTGTYQTAEGAPSVQLQERAGRLLVRPIPATANEGVPALLKDSGTWFPLRFTGPACAEVVNGALSGFHGTRFLFKRDEQGLMVLLADALGAKPYRRQP